MIDAKRLDELDVAYLLRMGGASYDDSEELLELARLGIWAREHGIIALKKTVISANEHGVWINSRTKGSAMIGLGNLKESDPEVYRSFEESGRLINEALEALPKGVIE